MVRVGLKTRVSLIKRKVICITIQEIDAEIKRLKALKDFRRMEKRMQEILAENLQPLFDNTSLTGKKTYSGELYEVWEVSDEDFQLMCEIDEEEFERLCPEGMWRSAV